MSDVCGKNDFGICTSKKLGNGIIICCSLAYTYAETLIKCLFWRHFYSKNSNTGQGHIFPTSLSLY